MKKLITSLLSVLLIVALLMPVVALGAPSPTLTKITKSNVDVTVAHARYDGTKKSATIKVKVGNKVLTEGTDYIVSGNLTPKATVGKYILKITVTGIGKYYGTVKGSVSFKIIKGTQTVTATKKYVVKRADLKKRSMKLKLDAVSNGNGKLVYKASKGIKVSSKGVVTLKKNLRKGTYTVKVYAKGTSNWKKSKTITIKIVVK